MKSVGAAAGPAMMAGAAFAADPIKIGLLEKDAVREAIAEGDARIDSPDGGICIDPESRRTSHRMRMIEVEADHTVKVIEDFGVIEPCWLGPIGCDPTQNDPDAPSTPTNPPQ
ncbi:MAG: hypothetical protein R6V44_11360 [Paracoccaceae bacterium]